MTDTTTIAPRYLFSYEPNTSFTLTNTTTNATLTCVSHAHTDPSNNGLTCKFSITTTTNNSNNNSSNHHHHHKTAIPVFGILGTISLLKHKYVAVITDAELVGTLFHNNDQIYRVQQVEWIPIGNLAKNDDEKSNDDGGELAQRISADEERYLNMLQFVMSQASVSHNRSSSFYFSYTYQLTNSLQVNLKKQKEILAKSSSSKVPSIDEHFHWNQHLTTDFSSSVDHAKNSQDNNNVNNTPTISQWTIPVIRGFVLIKNVVLNDGKSFKFSLISRLSHKRVGTRYFTRGIDSEGNAANYAETEQVIELGTDGGGKNTIFSFVQVRGSIPVHWSQKPCLKYMPKIKISDKKNDDKLTSFRKHFDHQLSRYKSVTVVNLVKSTGSENVLAQFFEKSVQKYENRNVSYNHFDFHAKHKKLSHKMIDELVTLVEKNIEDQGYFMYDVDQEEIKREQTGVVRVNCIDCLDRTNVAESIFASHVLVKQLILAGYLNKGETVKDHVMLDKVFKNAWADNGDILSNLYAGTGALKADITRTGKRTLVGLYNDGTNSMTRYFLNNFSDGQKLDSINLFLGKYVVNPHVDSPFKDYKTLNELATILMIVWLIVVYIMWGIFGKNGRSYVNNPVLVHKPKSQKNKSE